MKLGSARLDDALDVVRLIRSNRALATLLKMILTRHEKRLLRLQRQDLVLDIHSSATEAPDSDEIENKLTDAELLSRVNLLGDIGHNSGQFYDILKKGVSRAAIHNTHDLTNND